MAKSDLYEKGIALRSERLGEAFTHRLEEE
jgi:hypothetical protein